MKRTVTALVCCLAVLHTAAQSDPSDSSGILGEVIIKAYEQNRALKETPAGVNHIDAVQLNRGNDLSVLTALNATPGVRMEERSPGSYRLNVRGSTLRSPFGVRNVKIYWNNIPFTDPGGGTYLNQLSFYNFNTIEVIKGPGGSLYGAGTGGVVLINGQPQRWNPGADVSYIGGSYGLVNLNTQVKLGSEDRRNSIGYSHQFSDGYRDHTAMRRDVATWQTRIKANEKQELQASVLYGDLYYQTPGALTAAEYNNNPKGARPAAGTFPSADQAKAAIFQKTFLAGISNSYHFNEHFQNTTTLYGAFSQIKNPTFRNYERRVEPHFGGRTVFKWERSFSTTTLQLLAGGEGQKGFFNTKTFSNNSGNPGVLQTDDDINNYIYSGFVQANVQLAHDLDISGGVSINRSSITITRLSVPNFTPVKRSYNSEWAPRLAVSKRMYKGLWMYASVAKGFSPPTVSEILPSTSVISTGLNAEHGVSYEAGLKSSWLNGRLYLEVNAFSYQLHDAIVQRKDASNADYFTNAGSTRQRGLEGQANAWLLRRHHGVVSSINVWTSYTLNSFHYRSFKQGTADYSGKQLPSVAKNTVAAGADISLRKGIYLNLSYFYSDPIALTDANTAFAAPYHLLGAKLGWKHAVGKTWIGNLFAGADNLFDVTYSLGNDINAAGGRYYNAAPRRNFYVGIAVQWLQKNTRD